MTVLIPFVVEDTEKNCVIELRSIADDAVIAEIFHGNCKVGDHSIEFDTASVPGGLEAGVYLLHVQIGEQSQGYPFQYMP